MKRLAATIVSDTRLQSRNGFYYAAALVALFWIGVLTHLPVDNFRLLMPVFVLSNLMVNTFYFMGGLVLLEKTEGTLMAQVVTPLRTWEYLLSKVTTLTLLSLLENLLIVGVVYGLDFDPVPLVLGIMLAAALFVLTGFVAVSRYDSINEYLFPSILYTLAFMPPFLDYFGWVQSPLFYLHPMQAPLLLARGGFLPLPAWQGAYGVLYGLFWLWLIFLWSRRAFARFIIATERAA